MAYLILDHPGSWCFGTNLAPRDPITSRAIPLKPRWSPLIGYQCARSNPLFPWMNVFMVPTWCQT